MCCYAYPIAISCRGSLGAAMAVLKSWKKSRRPRAASTGTLRGNKETKHKQITLEEFLPCKILFFSNELLLAPLSLISMETSSMQCSYLFRFSFMLRHGNDLLKRQPLGSRSSIRLRLQLCLSANNVM